MRTAPLSLTLVSLGLGLCFLACEVTVQDGKVPDGTTTSTPTSTPATAEPTSVATAEPTASPSTLPNMKVCTKMGCVGALEVEVVGGDKLAKGKYVVDVEADGKKGKCTFVAPGFCGDKAPACDGEVEIFVQTLGCDATDKGAPAAKINELRLPSTPAAATITVTRDGKKVGEAKLAPQYKEVRPNGPDCNPVCKQAKDRLEIK